MVTFYIYLTYRRIHLLTILIHDIYQYTKLNLHMEDFEEKGFIRILLLLLENQNQPYSKYELQQISKLSKTTIGKRIISLKDLNLIAETPEVGPRARTEIRLTELGSEIAEFLKNIRDRLLDV